MVALCRNCPDYDLCEKCEVRSQDFHPTTHVFLKIKTPVMRQYCQEPLLQNVLYYQRDKNHGFGSIIPGSALVGISSNLGRRLPGSILVGTGTERDAKPKLTKRSDKDKDKRVHRYHQHHHRIHADTEQTHGAYGGFVSRPRDELREEIKKRRKLEKEQDKKLKLSQVTVNQQKGHGK